MQRFLDRHLAGGEVIGAEKIIAAAGFVDQRNVASLPRLDGERDADQLCRHFIETRRFSIDRDIADLVNPVEPDAQRFGVADLLVFGGVKRHISHLRRIGHGGGGGFRNGRGFTAQHLGYAFRQGAEFHFGQEAEQAVRIGVAHFEIVDGKVDRRIFVEQDKAAAQANLLGMVDEGLAAFGLLDLFGTFQERVQIAKFIDQQRRRLDPDAGRAGHVVNRIARQRLYVHDAVGVDTELLEHPIAVDGLVLHRIQHFHAVADELHQILVGANDRAAPPGGTGLHSQRGDDVIGLIALKLFAGDVERLGRGAGQRDLRAQIFGHGIAVGLVLVVHVVAEGMAALVEDHSYMRRRVGAGVAFDIAVQHVAEPGDRADRQAVGFARQRRQGVISAKDEGRAVDQMQVVAFAECHRNAPLGWRPFCHEAWPTARRQCAARAGSCRRFRCSGGGREGSDFAFEIRMDEFAIAVAAFDPAAILGDLQPDARMTKRAFAAVAGHAPSVHDAGFGRLQGHGVGPRLRR